MKKDVLEKMTALITAAFGLVAALAWNEAIKAFFKQYFGTADSLWGMLIYAVIVTVLAVFVTLELSKANTKAEDKEKKR